MKAAEADAWERTNEKERKRRQAREAASRGDVDAAVRLWEAVLEGRGAPNADAASVEVAADLTELGSALAALGRPGEALTVLRRSLALRPFDSGTLSTAGRAARAVGEAETADLYAARAVLTAPTCR